jgi:hypothetical protein
MLPTWCIIGQLVVDCFHGANQQILLFGKGLWGLRILCMINDVDDKEHPWDVLETIALWEHITFIRTPTHVQLKHIWV